jgi:magnesium transporter
MQTDSPQSATLPAVQSGEKRPGVIDSAAYAQGLRVANVEIADLSEEIKREDRFVWVGLYEPDEKLLREIQEELGLHDLAIEDAHCAHQRPKLEQYENCLFVVLRTAQIVGEPHHLEFGETHIFVGPRYVVSVRHGSLRSHVGLRARCEASQRLLAKGPGFVLYALMDFVVDQYLPIVETLEEQVVELEEVIFGEKLIHETTSRIYHLKRELLSIKRAVWPLVDVCNRLMRFDVELVPADTKPYFRDVYDHAVRINAMVHTLRELLGTALDANLSLIMPELSWRYGYEAVLGPCCAAGYGWGSSGWLAVKGPRLQAAGSGTCTERSRPQDKAFSALQLTFWPPCKCERASLGLPYASCLRAQSLRARASRKSNIPSYPLQARTCLCQSVFMGLEPLGGRKSTAFVAAQVTRRKAPAVTASIKSEPNL